MFYTSSTSTSSSTSISLTATEHTYLKWMDASAMRYL